MRYRKRLQWIGLALLLVVLVTALDRAKLLPVPADVDPATEVSEESVMAATTTPSVAPLEPRSASSPSTAVSDDVYEVVAVVDGDTIDVNINGVVSRVRYIGINTPETVHPTRAVECFGTEASARNKLLVAGKYVGLEKDVSETDKYGRLLRYVYVDGEMVNELLVREGFANVSTYPPDVRYTERFLTAERLARAEGKGLWGEGCEPYQNSAAVSTAEAPAAVSGGSTCTIKGNISAEGERIYHVLGCQSYERTVITEAKEERWFCSEEEARAAGWRKALNCP